MKSKSPLKLSERELDIMQVLWQRGQATVAEVQAALNENGETLAHNTVQTVLNRLEGKNLVARDSSDRAHIYSSLVEEPAAVNGVIRRLTNRFFSGSVEALVTRLIEEDLKSEQLERIQALIEQQREKGGGK